MKEMVSRGNDKRFFASKANKFERGDWLDNQDVCQMLNISPRTLQTLRDNGTLAYSQINHKVYYKLEDVESILHVVAGRDRSNVSLLRPLAQLLFMSHMSSVMVFCN